MNIATQGGKIITKDGKLGTDCACCGGWYCYGGSSSCVCPTNSIAGITVNITATDFLKHMQYTDSNGTLWYGSYLSLLSRINGSHALSPSDSTKTYWTKKFPTSMWNVNGCVLCGSVSNTDIMLTFAPYAGSTEISVSICAYSTWVSRNEYATSMPMYFQKGDTVSVQGTTIAFPFGMYSGDSERLGDTYDPSNAQSPRVAWVQTFADCCLISSECTNGSRVWSPSFPATFSQPRHNFPLHAFSGGSVTSVDSVTGNESVVVNSIEIAY